MYGILKEPNEKKKWYAIVAGEVGARDIPDSRPDIIPWPEQNRPHPPLGGQPLKEKMKMQPLMIRASCKYVNDLKFDEHVISKFSPRQHYLK